MSDWILLPNGIQAEVSHFVERAEELRKFEWTFQVFKNQPALIDKNGGTSRIYVGQNYDPEFINLVVDGWKHDHCELCTTRISEDTADFENQKEGYTFERTWICKSCFDNFISVTHLKTRIAAFKTLKQ